MSLKVFELTEEHIALVRQIRWAMIADTFYDNEKPFGTENVGKDMCEIIYGLPETMDDFDPLSDEEPDYTDEQYDHVARLYEELPTALDVILSTGKFETGTYATRYHVRDWKKWNDKQIERYKKRKGHVEG